MEGTMACARCRRRVNVLRRDDEPDAYFHASITGAPDPDHVPEPVMVAHADAILSCDFCGAAHPQWNIPLRTRPEMVYQGPNGSVTTGDDGWWSACDECEALIRARKIRQLRQRSVDCLPEGAGIPPERAREHMRLVHAAFWLSKPGEAIPTEMF